ncbi:MAG: hypothetical protein HWN66_08835 [Candidatus Helarchaeota archaeon]|nr:hypothetical protein [Candidatus Helarchaeota archaeon]
MKMEDIEQNWVNKMYEKLTTPKTIKICGYTALILFFGLFITAIIVALPPGPIDLEPYTIWNNWISDMGSYKYTPAPFLLDTMLIGTGILLVPFHLYLEKHLAPIPRDAGDFPIPHRWTYRLTELGFFLNCLGSFSMICVGIFSEDRSFGLHFPFSVLLFGSFAFGAIFLGLAFMITDPVIVPKPFNYILGVYGVHGLFIIGGFAGYHLLWGTPLEKLMEWVIFFALMAWMLPISFFAMRHAEKLLNEK